MEFGQVFEFHAMHWQEPLEIFGLEPVDRLLDAVFGVDLRFPAQGRLGEADVGLANLGVVLGKIPVDDLTLPKIS